MEEPAGGRIWGGLSLGWGKVCGCLLLPSLLLSSLVVTGATSGIGKAYAHEVSHDVLQPREC